ncbi:chromatin modification-related protein eaf-1 [Scaptodrosophila lebanonensis]|uniref:Chromatin modification-related protein eaf-1 n=1 Tax=Drosophila lebanonensis TaxID=7225 RepID=A0A6J2T0H9_DROLE|nr:chromatin modification-related protein eaf-1 [Scaptodrosophila lebanonensis]
MAATSAGQQQQQQHKLNIVANAETVGGMLQINEIQGQQQHHQQLPQPQQINLQERHIYKQQQQMLPMQHHQQQQQQQLQFFQQQQTKFVSRVATNANKQQQQQQQQQQILPAGLVNGNGNIMHQQQQQQQQRHTAQHVFVCPTTSPHLQQQQQQQQQLRQRQTQIKLPFKSPMAAAATAVGGGGAGGTTSSMSTVATTHCLPPTIASRQMSQNSQLYVKNVANANNAISNNNGNNSSSNRNNIIINGNSSSSSNKNSNINSKSCNYNYNANLAPGWRRLTNNNEVAYISPTGKTLRTQFQIKDYLLAQGTCKCGLPCPLRPEYFFDFNAQVPNMPWKPAAGIKATNGNTNAKNSTGGEASSSSSISTPCLHQLRFIESQQPPAQSSGKDVATSTAVVGSDVYTLMRTTMTMSAMAVAAQASETIRTSSSSTPAAVATATATTTTTITTPTPTKLECANKDTDCLKYGDALNAATTKLSPYAVPTTPAVTTMLTSQAVAIGKGSRPMHVINGGENRNQVQQQPTPPPAPPPQQQQQLQQQQQQKHVQQQKPNFNDDPAGYMQQQTALLHNTLSGGLEGGNASGGGVMSRVENSVSISRKAQLICTTAKALPQEPIVHSSQQMSHPPLQQQKSLSNLQQRQRIRRLSLFAGGKWELEPSGARSLHVETLPPAFVRPQKPQISSITVVSAPQDSPVSSSTAMAQARNVNESEKRPEQVGAISTSHESPRHSLSSPTESPDSLKSAPSASPVPQPQPQQQSSTLVATLPTHAKAQILQMRVQNQQLQQQVQQASAAQHTQVRIVRQAAQPTRLPVASTVGATLTRSIVTTIAGASRAANTLTTMTSTAAGNHIQKLSEQKISPNNQITVSQLQQLQPLLRPNDLANNGSQIIMTSSGQLLVIPAASSKPQAQQQRQAAQPTNVIIQQQAGANELPQLAASANGGLILQNGAQHSHSNGSGYLVGQPSGANASSSATTVILNSSHNILTAGGAKLLHAGGQQLIATPAGGHHQLISTSQAASQAGQAATQTVVLNTLPNGGYIVQQPAQSAAQPLDTTQLMSSTHHQVHQHHTMQQPTANTQALIISSPETKRRQRKRKSSLSISTPPSSPAKIHSPQISPSIPSQAPALLQQAAAAAAAQQTTHPQVVQITTGPAAASAQTAQFPQQFQLSPGIQGIVVNKPASQPAPQTHQLLLQNGQILQHVNLIGQQLLMPAGLVMAPDTTLLQIQNVGACAPGTSILTPQGPVMLRTPSPQNKPFISPSASGQQYIVGANGQLSPIGQIYSTPMGLVMPTAQQTNQTGAATAAAYVQASPTATIQLQPQPHPNQQQQQQAHQQIGLQSTASTTATLQPVLATNTEKSYIESMNVNGRHMTAASPPDTTTCSPHSPERPPSHRSTGSDMVQCVSSSEPDAAVSPQSTDSRQSPSSTDCERGIYSTHSFSQPSSVFKPMEPKIRRLHITSQAAAAAVSENGNGALTGLGMGAMAQVPAATMATAPSAGSLMHSQVSAHHAPPSHSHIMHSNRHSNNHSHSQPSSAYMHLNNHKVVSVEYQESSTSPPNIPSTTTTKTVPPSALPPAEEPSDAPPRMKATTSTPSKRTRQRAVRVTPSNMLPLMPPRSFAIGELIWGPARGHPAWPGKIVKMPDGMCTPSKQFDHVCVQWFGGGGRSTSELIPVNLLQSLSEGLEAHHKAQKDTRKSRKLNSQLERAIQEAMTELDNISASSTTTSASTMGSPPAVTHNHSQQQPTSTSNVSAAHIVIANSSNNNNSSSSNINGLARNKRVATTSTVGGGGGSGSSVVLTASTLSGLFSQQRPKPIRIAPAPPSTGTGGTAAATVSATAKAELLRLTK